MEIMDMDMQIAAATSNKLFQLTPQDMTRKNDEVEKHMHVQYCVCNTTGLYYITKHH
jgi:hypothetical protein